MFGKKKIKHPVYQININTTKNIWGLLSIEQNLPKSVHRSLKILFDICK